MADKEKEIIMNPMGYRPSVTVKPMATRLSSLDGKAIFLAAPAAEVGLLFAAGRCVIRPYRPGLSGGNRHACMATGQAAGVAAPLASQQKVTPRQPYVTLLQQKLLEQALTWSPFLLLCRKNRIEVGVDNMILAVAMAYEHSKEMAFV